MLLRLRCYILTQLLSSPSASPASQLHRLFSAAAPGASPNPSFAVEEYLVATCGLTRPQALKASAKLSHLRSPANPDAVLAFLAGLGLSDADVAALVARDPQFLCASVERTLTPVAAGLSGLGLSRSDIARLASLAAHKFRQKSVLSKLQYYLRLFGTSHNFLRVMKFSNILSHSIERVVKPNVAYLRECGLQDCDIAKFCIQRPRMIISNPEHVQAMVACAENIGVPRASGMFRHALQAVAFLGEEEITVRVGYLKSTFRWTDAEVGMAVSKFPPLLRGSEKSLQRRFEFLISEVGLESAYIAQRPVMLGLSLEGRLRPRHYAVKFIKENGLLKCDPSYYTVFKESDMTFKKKFIHPHKEAAPHLEKDYDAACKGEVPTNFRFT
ncbi:hypothetical protein CFC21_081541 [Triticum aestivum]|uniref:Uncharacterized protein n=3 Tax=Triticum TaxID=4564 RepID=A0A9R0XRZ7_TRITD|nr:uncharacterized protein LOC123129959 [Triticum aestivum]XP_048537168.1 uncharacterized protein LOC125515694 [Triticum urartu]XP_048537180.1 uncharacterized protein LOC125515712 [Triticum urartu]KAF7076943.1 hypothetical protein CFC21_081541 [Triticum aestivum]VAI41435.1 unnamed protein product [Triticum turgidum subsp. durum]